MGNQGISLIEVVVSLAIFGLVIVGVCSFMDIGMHTSTTSYNIASLQKEAQQAENQLSKWLMESNGELLQFKNEAMFDEAFVIEQHEKGEEACYAQVIYFIKEESRLYYHKIKLKDSMGVKKEDIIKDAQSIAGNREAYLFSRWVTGIEIDLTKVQEEIVTFEIQYELMGKKHEVNHVVHLRNKR